MWRQGDFPFIFVQLANYLESRPETWRQRLGRPARGATAIARGAEHGDGRHIDIGEWNDIHPLDKKTVGLRLALAARALAYGETELVASGPMFGSLMRRGKQLIVEFTNTGGGLEARGERVEGFAIAGEDGEYRWAEARIHGDSVVLQSDAVEVPVRVRYAWADNPERANLYNAEDLPASPFQASTKGREPLGPAAAGN